MGKKVSQATKWLKQKLQVRNGQNDGILTAATAERATILGSVEIF